MGKRETQDTYKQIQIDKTKAEADAARVRAEADQRAALLKAQSDAGREELGPLYQGMSTAGPDSRFNVAGTASWNNVDSSNMDAMRGKWSEFGKTGGVSDATRASIGESVAGLKELGRTGGMTDENIARIRGLGGYDEFAKTGGYTPTDLANIKLQAISPIGAYAQGTRDELDRRRALTGGYAPGFDAASRQLSRDTSRGIADTSLNANVMLKDRVNAGRQWGISGVSGSEQALTQQMNAVKLAGLTGAGGLEMQLQELTSRYMAMGLSGEQAATQAVADIEALNSQGNYEANTFNIQNIQNQGAASAADQFARNQLGMSGLHNLYNTDVSREFNERQFGQNAYRDYLDYNMGMTQSQNQNAQQPGIGSQIARGIGTGAGIASDYFNARNQWNSPTNVGGVPSYNPIPGGGDPNYPGTNYIPPPPLQYSNPALGIGNPSTGASYSSPTLSPNYTPTYLPAYDPFGGGTPWDNFNFGNNFNYNIPSLPMQGVGGLYTGPNVTQNTPRY